LLGKWIGVQANVGGGGIAMLLLIVAHNMPQLKHLATGKSAEGITFWSAMYIPIVVAMAARQIERILRHLSVWDPQPQTRSPAGPDPPWPNGETMPLTYHPVADIA
jgi:hypothetical protein